MTWRGFGAQMKALRQQRGLSQEALAAKAGLSRIYVAKLEAGERLSPSLPALERLATALGATLQLSLDPKPDRRTKGGGRGR